MIEKYSFGKLTFNNKLYSSDILILPDQTILSWWRKSGHLVKNDDLQKVYEKDPSVLILGTGAFGVMKVADEVKEYCQKQNIRLITEKTGKAVEQYNNLKDTKKSAGFHLTC
ncbi:MAG: hypothetical protein KKH98_13210 [Spirochaetes bacterium]|nr:hypothetical protein [Spirochaetota bacterium]